jgi:hypothetical protein
LVDFRSPPDPGKVGKIRAEPALRRFIGDDEPRDDSFSL